MARAMREGGKGKKNRKHDRQRSSNANKCYIAENRHIRNKILKLLRHCYHFADVQAASVLNTLKREWTELFKRATKIRNKELGA